MDACKENGVKKVVFSSSAAIYGENPESPKRTDMRPKPKSPYGITKLDGEYYLQMYNEQYGLGAVSLRYFNVFGPRQDPKSQYAAAVPIFIANALQNEPITIYGDGEQTRAFTHVSDVVRANLLAMHSPMVGGAEIINIGTGRNYSMWDVARMMLGKNPDTDPKELLDAGLCKLIADRRGEARISLADISKAKRLLDWEPKINLKIGLKQLLGK